MNASAAPVRRRPWRWGIVLLLIIVAGVVAFMRRQDDSKVTYREVAVERGDLQATILSTGVVEPENRLEIKPPIAGRIEEVLVKEGQTVRKGQILAWMSSTERAALLDAARSKGAEELKRWEQLYRPTPVMAPISGTIILRNVESGQSFTNVDPVFVMSDRLTVKAQVDETDIAQIKLKQSASIILDAYPEQTIPARVDQIAYDATTVNNVTTYVVDALPESTPPTMRSGMTANVTFIVAEKQAVLLLPNDAIRVVDQRRTVMMKAPKGHKPLEQEITVGLTDGKRTEIVDGLNEGDTVLAAEFKATTARTGNRPSNPLAPNMPRGGGRR